MSVFQAADNFFARGNRECEVDAEVLLAATAREIELPSVSLAPAPEPSSQTVARIFDEGPLIGSGIWWRDGGGLVVHMHLDLNEALLNEEPGYTIAARVVTFAESNFSPLADGPSAATALLPGPVRGGG